MRRPDEAAEEEAYREMQRETERICSLIIASDYAGIDIVIQIQKLRQFAEEHFPDRVDLFRLIYESRFKRLWEQFREESQGSLPDW